MKYDFSAFEQTDYDAFKDVFDTRGADWEYESWLRQFEAYAESYMESNIIKQIVTMFDPTIGIMYDSINKLEYNNHMENIEFDIGDYENVDKTEYLQAKNRALFDFKTQLTDDWASNIMFAYQYHGSPKKGDPKVDGSPEGWDAFNIFSEKDDSARLDPEGWSIDQTHAETYLQQKYNLNLPWDKDLYGG